MKKLWANLNNTRCARCGKELRADAKKEKVTRSGRRKMLILVQPCRCIEPVARKTFWQKLCFWN